MSDPYNAAQWGESQPSPQAPPLYGGAAYAPPPQQAYHPGIYGQTQPYGPYTPQQPLQQPQQQPAQWQPYQQQPYYDQHHLAQQQPYQQQEPLPSGPHQYPSLYPVAPAADRSQSAANPYQYSQQYASPPLNPTINFDQQENYTPAAPPPPPRHAGASVPYNRRRQCKGNFNKKAWLHAQGYTDEDMAEARTEHAPRTFPMCTSTDVFAERHGGHGVRMYFEFIKYFAFIVFLIGALQAISFGLAVDESHSSFSQDGNGHPFYYGFFINEYTGEVKTQWIALNVASFVIAFIGVPLYYFYVGCRWEEQEARLKGQNTEFHLGFGTAPRTDTIVRLTDHGYIDVSAHYRTFSDLVLRRLVSFLIFAIFLAAQVFVTFYLTQQDDERGNLGISLAVAVFAVILDFLYTVIATLLTEFEKHKFNSAAIRWLALKLMLFRVANIMTVYGARSYTAAEKTCVYAILAEQFLGLWIVEIILVAPGTVIGTMIWHKRYDVYARFFGSIGSDESNMPAFQLAREYLKMLYLAFLSYAGMTVFPLSVWLGFFAIAAQYWSAKFRLSKLCGRPLVHDTSQRSVVIVGLLLAAIAGLLTPSAGGAFIMSGFTRDRTNSTCVLP
jgi:hypothetical protein